MLFELPFLSFICLAFLVAANLVRHVREDIPVLSIVAWLIVCNLIHGINASVWAGNSQLHAPAWCDIGIYDQFSSRFIVVSCDISHQVSSRSNDSAACLLPMHNAKVRTRC